MFTGKTLIDERLILVENNGVILEDGKLVELLKKYFGNVENLGMIV